MFNTKVGIKMLQKKQKKKKPHPAPPILTLGEGNPEDCCEEFVILFHNNMKSSQLPVLSPRERGWGEAWGGAFLPNFTTN